MPLLILVVDDDPGICLLVNEYLETSGYLAIAAKNGKKALELLEEYQPHLMVTDVIMPELDGYELVRQVRQRPMFRLMPIVFLTARAAPQERIRSYQLGGDIHIAKPFDLDELSAIIRHLLERSQLMHSEWRLRTQGQSIEEFEAAAAPTSQITLTRREQQVLALLIEGLSNPQIGARLHLSPRTIEKYISSLLHKTESNNRVELVRFAIAHNLAKQD